MFGKFQKNTKKTESTNLNPSEEFQSAQQSNQPTEINPDDAKQETQNNTIAYEDFTKVEMTVGQIASAEKVENADRLLKLKVDFGTETRQIVSGIAEFYTPEDIVGKKCPFVTNLEPRTIRGVESNGMILAAKDSEGNFSLLNVDESVVPGTKLS
jgi:methionyl-tRNA synthetase